MDGQLAFRFDEPVRSDLVYFALRPDAAAARAAMKVARTCRDRFGLSGRLYGADRLHLSLCPVMSQRGFRKDDVASAATAAARMKREPFSVVFDRISTLHGRDARPITLCGNGRFEDLAALREALRNELLKAGLWPGTSRFRPHVTLLWDRRRVPETPLDTPIRWLVEDFVLVRSVIGRSRHVDLGRWPLHD